MRSRCQCWVAPPATCSALPLSSSPWLAAVRWPRAGSICGRLACARRPTERECRAFDGASAFIRHPGSALVLLRRPRAWLETAEATMSEKRTCGTSGSLDAVDGLEGKAEVYTEGLGCPSQAAAPKGVGGVTSDGGALGDLEIGLVEVAGVEMPVFSALPGAGHADISHEEKIVEAAGVEVAVLPGLAEAARVHVEGGAGVLPGAGHAADGSWDISLDKHFIGLGVEGAELGFNAAVAADYAAGNPPYEGERKKLEPDVEYLPAGGGLLRGGRWLRAGCDGSEAEAPPAPFRFPP
ncbi:unnamed protein product [Prorocentrum cordatum]|uniref:Uncharacterized protein n=1 Tax=Prorocentrum cordatum TaxID=2364126 RepID=A0ABN9XH50_9DINO|nr:unnamed protein product [Polarella glacialis]